MIVDAHVHVYPEEVLNDRARFCRLDRAFASIYRNPHARMASQAEVLAAMDEAGVEKAVIFGFPWGDSVICKDHNDHIAEVCATSKERLIGLGCMSPALGERGIQEAERCLNGGLQGIGELAAYGDGGGKLDAPFFRDLAALLCSRQRPLLLHATESVGHAYPGKDRTDLRTLYRWLEDHPDLDVVLAHWGGGLFFYELMPEVKERCRRVYYDTAASPFLYRPEIYKVALEIVGEDRLLLGSDFPLIHPRRYLKEIQALGLPQEELAGLLGKNAARLWQWGEAGKD